MTIRVAKDGYDGTYMPISGALFINGVLHRAVQPMNSNDIFWIPIRSYDGPVEHVDRRGKPVAAPPSGGNGAGPGTGEEEG